MAEEINPPRGKPPKRHLLGCFGCRFRRETFKSELGKEGEDEKKRKMMKPRRLHWSISKSAAATVPVEEDIRAPSIETVLAPARSQEHHGRQAVSAATSDCHMEGQSFEEQSPPPVLPPPPRPPPEPTTMSAVVHPDPTRDPDGPLDPVVGMSIVMVTLIVLVSWGGACAVLCTAAWFYVVPRLRRPGGKEGKERARGDVDLSSEESKKRVVLEGLLERNRRPPPIVL